MPPRAKKPGNQHNSRHENGVVAPGKRVTKQRSNGNLEGSADGTSRPNGSPSPSASTARTTPRLPDKRTHGAYTSTQGDLQAVQEPGKTQLDIGSEGSEALSNRTSHANGSLEQTHRKIDVNVAKNPLVHANSIWQSTLTVLRSCPLGDTITILIVLLSLPPTILTVTNALFAMLTFITPTGPSSLPTTFHEIFQGSGGTPSLATIVLTDIIGLMLWLVLWTPMQTLSIELAQAMVATQLGGGNASKKKGSDRTMLCMGIVSASHVARYQWIPKRLFGYDWSAILSSIPYVSRSPPLSSGNDFIPMRSPAGWIRILIALHILIQGLVHVARRWYQKREYTQAVSISKKKEPEGVAGSPSRPTLVAPAEAKPQIAVTSSDLTPKLPPALTKDARDKISSGKKKRKQGTYVRSQQPLWAAFAHTKVTVLREYEQSHTHSEASESNATNTTNLGNAPFLAEERRVWVSNMLPTSFRFHATQFPTPRPVEPSLEESKITASAAIDRSKPLHVRINDTDWTSTRIESSTDAGEVTDGEWTGEVFGLSPSSSYRCSFVQSGDGMVVYSTTVTTPAPLTDDNGMYKRLMKAHFALANINSDLSLISAALPHRVHRPSSPTTPSTTLKNSIAAFEVSLSEAQARQKRSRKEAKTASAALKREIDVPSSKMAKVGGEERQHHNRHWQWNQNSKQADDAVAAISGEIESIGCLPEDDLKLSKETKVAWDETREHQSLARENLFQSKDDAYRVKSSAQNEAITAQQKSERLSTRKTKLNDQHKRLQSSTSQGLDDKQRKNSEQAARELERVQFEQRCHEQMAMYQRAINDSGYHVSHIRQQTQAMNDALTEKQTMDNAQFERPLTPEGDLPGTLTHNAATSAFRYPAFGSQDQPNGLRSNSGSLRHSDHRPRSTSMFSGNSVYADFDDEDPAPPIPARAVEVIRERGRKRSEGGGSGSSGSQRDPASPVLGSMASPIGKRSPVWNS